jgi:hypothetical protein
MRFNKISYKVRRLNQIVVCTMTEDNKSWRLQEEVDMLKEEIENLNLELDNKTDELQQIKYVREIECEISSLRSFVLINIDSIDDVPEKMVLIVRASVRAKMRCLNC